MPKFPKNDGFSLGANPFKMNKGSKEIHTEGSFRQEATNKMQEHADGGSPFFAIQPRDIMKATLGHEGSSPFTAIEGRSGRGSGAYEDTSSDLGDAVDQGLADGKAIAGELGLDEEEGGEPSIGGGDIDKEEARAANKARQEALDTLGNQKEEQDKTDPWEVKAIQL